MSAVQYEDWVICDVLSVLGRSPYNDSDVVQLESSDSSSDATASCSATCSSSDSVWENNTSSQRLVSSAAPSTRSVTLSADMMCLSHCSDLSDVTCTQSWSISRFHIGDLQSVSCSRDNLYFFEPLSRMYAIQT